VIKKPDLKKKCQIHFSKNIENKQNRKKKSAPPLFLPPARTAKLAASSEN
jgi:hypothetical protein